MHTSHKKYQSTSYKKYQSTKFSWKSELSVKKKSLTHINKHKKVFGLASLWDHQIPGCNEHVILFVITGSESDGQPPPYHNKT